MAFDLEQFVQISDPDHQGRVTVTWNDETIELCINWSNLKLMQMAFGEQFIETCTNALDYARIDDLERMVMMCARRPGSDEFIPRDEVESWTFPVNPMRDALKICWGLAWNGGVLGSPDEEEKDAGKKRRGPLTSLRQYLSDVLRPD